MDVEDRSVTLSSDEHTIRSVLDTLTSCCMQMAELLQSGQGGDRTAANSLSALLKKNKKAAELPTADQVEFWKSPEKSGWMQSQGEHIRTWRKRWFVLKHGFLFRFASPDVGPSSQPRGIVDLSQVTDVSDGSAATGRQNSIKLSTSTGSRCYITESETAQVEWISALENSVAKIVKIIAGVDEEESTPAMAASRALAEQFRSYSGNTRPSSGRTSGNGIEARRRDSSERNQSFSFGKEQRSGSGSGSARGGGFGRDQMVNVVNYGGLSSSPPSASAPTGPSSYGGGGGPPPSSDYGGFINVDYGGMTGVGFQVAPPETADVGYGGGPGGGGGSGMYGNVYNPPPSMGDPRSAMPVGGHIPQHGMDMGGYGGGGGGGYPSAVQSVPQQYQQPPTMDHHQQHYQPPHLGGNDYGASVQAQHAQQQQQPSGPNLMDAVTTPAGPPQSTQSSSPWQVHYTPDGRPYYYNLQTQITQWEAPAA